MSIGHQSYDGLNGGDSPTPAKGWSASDKLTSQKSDRTVSLQAMFSEPGMYTVQFAIIQNQTRTKEVKTEALIEWSVEGNTIIRRVSVVNGTTVSGPGQAVRCVVSDVSVATAPAENLDYQVGINVTRGTRPNTATPPILIGGQLILAPGANGNFSIPQNAGVTSVNVVVRSLLFGPVLDQEALAILFDSFSGTNYAEYDVRSIEWMPISPGADSIQCKNNSSTPDTLFFYVTFGIDG